MYSHTLNPMHGRSASAFPLNQTGAELVYDVSTYATAAVQAVATGGWTTAVLTIYRSLDGVYVFPLSDPQTIGPSDGITDTIDVAGCNYLIVRATTLEGSAAFAKVTAIAKGGQ
jgi:hypothetical protein